MRVNSKWEVKKLGEVCIVIAGQSPEGNYYNNNGKGLPFYQGKKEFTDKYVGYPTVWTTKITKKAQKGDILIPVRPPVGPINFATEKICIGRGLAAIRPVSEKGFSNDYLFLFLMSIKGEIKGSVGAVFASINKNQIENILVPVPPINDQKKIVAKLDKFSENIKRLEDVARKNLQNAKDLFNSVLNETFKNKSVAANDNRQAYKKAHWEVKKLGEVCDILYNKRKPVAKKDRVNGRYPYYGSSGILDYVSQYIFNERLVLIGEDGAKWGIGEQTAFIAEGKYWVNNHAHVVRPHKDKMLDTWLVYYLNITDVSGYVNGLTVPKLNQERMKSITIPLLSIFRAEKNCCQT